MVNRSDESNPEIDQSQVCREADLDFGETQCWIFDLDNTLYPAECNLFAQIDERMGQFICDFLKIGRDEAKQVQKHYFVEYGTTLNGLMTVHGLQPEKFLDYVHDIDHSAIEADERLSEALDRLPGRKMILTSGTAAHAERVIDKLGVTHHFAEIYDIVATDFAPKPHAQAFHNLIDATGIDASVTAIFEDIARNLEVPHVLGMTTILVRSSGEHPDYRLGILGTGDEPHVHHVTDDLPEFLSKLSNSFDDQS